MSTVAPLRDQPAKPSILTISFQRFTVVSGQRKIWRSLVRTVTSLAVGKNQHATRAPVKLSACSIRDETFGRDTLVGVQIGINGEDCQGAGYDSSAENERGRST